MARGAAEAERDVDEWSDDEDMGYVVLSLSEAEFGDFVERAVAERDRIQEAEELLILNHLGVQVVGAQAVVVHLVHRVAEVRVEPVLVQHLFLLRSLKN